MNKKNLLVLAVLISLVSMPLFAGYPDQDPWDNSSQQTGQYNPVNQSGQSNQSSGCYCGPVQEAPPANGGGYDSGYGQDNGALQSLLYLVITDLGMCESELHARRFGYFDSIKAIGHINNARSAISRAHLAPGYASLKREVYDRLGRIRFHLLMNDVRYAVMLCNQLRQVVQGMMNTHRTTSYAMPPVNTVPVTPGSTSFGGWSQGQNVSIQVGSTNLTPVN